MIPESLDYAKAARYCMPMYVKMLFFFFTYFVVADSLSKLTGKGTN